MNKKLIAYAILPALAFTIAGVGFASAHGAFGGRGMFFAKNITPEEAAAHQEVMFTHQAELLGLSADQVKEAWAEGKDFKTLAEEAGITQEDLQAKMEAERKATMEEHVKALVEKGVITQEQADKRLEWVSSRVPGKGRGMMMFDTDGDAYGGPMNHMFFFGKGQ